MPELPEVEFAKGVLATALVGARVVRATGEDALVIHGDLERLAGERVTGIERRGKRLRFAFEAADLVVFSHLGMSGEWVQRGPRDEALRFERLRIDARKGRTDVSVRYVDSRRLGRFEVAREDSKAWRALGPDAWADGVDAKALFEALAARRDTVKQALLDQRVLAGVGNIHAIEALWLARIDPRSRSAALTLRDVRAVARGVRESLAAALGRQGESAASGEGGASERESRAKKPGRARAEYVNAGAPNRFRIYGRAGTACPRCKGALAKMVLGGRGTTFCPGCQRRIE